MLVDQLPMQPQRAAYPLSGFVINIGVATNGHCDSFDKIICIVVPLEEWEGRELCLYKDG